jgi:hypothetical protein
MTKMEQTSSDGTSVFDILRARMGMPPIESVLALPTESHSWSQQIVDALRRHWMSVLRTSFLHSLSQLVNSEGRRGTT